MRFHVLGPLEVRNSDTPTEVNGHRQRVLLAALLVEPNRWVMADHLVDALWPENPPETARQQVRNSISALRRGLAAAGASAGLIRSRTGGYTLCLDGHTVDAEDFRAHRDAAERYAVQGAAEDAVDAMRSALALWRGSAFDGIDSDVIRAEASRLNEQRLETYEACIDLEMALGRHARVVGELAALVVEYPLRERFVRQLMLALYRSGRTADALEQFHRTRERLADELGLYPSSELTTVYQSILREAPELGEPEPPPVAVPPRLEDTALRGWRGHRCPTHRVFGRTVELRLLSRLVRDRRLVTVIGAGGCGKSTVALKAAETVADAFDTVVAVSLARSADQPDVIVSLASRLDLPRHETREAAQQAVEARLGTLRGLLLLDDCEQLGDEFARWVSHILASCPGLRVLATSRQPLGLPDERVHLLGPLAEGDAIRLFLERAENALPTFAATTADIGRIARICRRLDGIPLAVELAAAKVRTLSVEGIAERLDRDLSLLAGETPRSDRRHRTIFAPVEGSHRHLQEPQRRLLSELSVFPSTFSLREAEVVCGDVALPRKRVAAELSSLVDRSLVHVEGCDEGRRYRLLSPIREYVSPALPKLRTRLSLAPDHPSDPAGHSRNGFSCGWSQVKRGSQARVPASGHMAAWSYGSDAPHDHDRLGPAPSPVRAGT